jgi:hypothetical protein
LNKGFESGFDIKKDITPLYIDYAHTLNSVLGFDEKDVLDDLIVITDYSFVISYD